MRLESVLLSKTQQMRRTVIEWYYFSMRASSFTITNLQLIRMWTINRRTRVVILQVVSKLQSLRD